MNRYGDGEVIRVDSYVVPNNGPYRDDIPLRNQIRFTPTQVEAIRSGMNEVSSSQPFLTPLIRLPYNVRA